MFAFLTFSGRAAITEHWLSTSYHGFQILTNHQLEQLNALLSKRFSDHYGAAVKTELQLGLGVPESGKKRRTLLAGLKLSSRRGQTIFHSKKTLCCGDVICLTTGQMHDVIIDIFKQIVKENYLP